MSDSNPENDPIKVLFEELHKKYKLLVNLDRDVSIVEGKTLHKVQLYLQVSDVVEITDLNVLKIVYSMIEIIKKKNLGVRVDILEFILPNAKVSYSPYDSQRIVRKIENLIKLINKLESKSKKCSISCALPYFVKKWGLENFFEGTLLPSCDVGVCGGCFKSIVDKLSLVDWFKLTPPQSQIIMRSEVEYIPFMEPSFINGEKELILEENFEYTNLKLYKIVEDFGGRRLERALKYLEITVPFDEINACLIDISDSKTIDALLQSSILGVDVVRVRNVLANAIQRMGYDEKIAKAASDWMLGIKFWFEVLQWHETKEVIIRSETQASQIILKSYGKCLMNWNPADVDVEYFASWASRATHGLRDWNTHKLELSLTPEHQKVPFTCRMTFLKPPHSIGYTLLIRMQEEDRLGIADLVLHGTCSEEEIAYAIMRMIRPYSDMAFIGGVGSGKTVSQFCIDSFNPQFAITEMIGDIFEGRDPALDGRLTYYMVADRSKDIMEVGVTRDKVIDSSLRSRAEKSNITEVITPDDTYAWIYSRLCNRAGSTTYHAKDRFEFLKRVYIDLTSKGLTNAGELLCGAMQMVIECIASLDRNNPSKYSYRWGAVSDVGEELFSKDSGGLKLPKLHDLWVYDPILDRHLKAYELPKNHPSYVTKQDWERIAFLENRHFIALQRAFPVPIHQIYNPKNVSLSEYGVWVNFVKRIVDYERKRREDPTRKNRKDLKLTSVVEVQIAYRLVEMILNNINQFNVKFGEKFKEIVESEKKERMTQLIQTSKGGPVELKPSDILEIEKKALEKCKSIYEPFWMAVQESLNNILDELFSDENKFIEFKNKYEVVGDKNV